MHEAFFSSCGAAFVQVRKCHCSDYLHLSREGLKRGRGICHTPVEAGSMAEATREGLNAPASRAMRSSEVGSMAEAIREREPKPSFICRLCSPLRDVSLGSLQWAEHHILSLA